MTLLRDQVPCPDCGRWNILWRDHYSCGCGFAGHYMQVYGCDLSGGWGFIYQWTDADDRKSLHVTAHIAAKAGCEASLPQMTADFRKKVAEPFAAALRVGMVRLGGDTPEKAEAEVAKLLEFTVRKVSRKDKAKV